MEGRGGAKELGKEEGGHAPHIFSHIVEVRMDQLDLANMTAFIVFKSKIDHDVCPATFTQRWCGKRVKTRAVIKERRGGKCRGF